MEHAQEAPRLPSAENQLLAWEDGHVAAIRDYRYVPYIAAEAELEVL